MVSRHQVDAEGLLSRPGTARNPRRTGCIEETRASFLCAVERSRNAHESDQVKARITRLDDRYERALSKAQVRPMDFTGRPMKGYVFVDAPSVRTQKSLAAWVTQCLEFVSTLRK
jgi:hypothetical protein